MKYLLVVLLGVVLITGCSSRPTPLPNQYSKTLPWGAIDLDINSTQTLTIRNSFGKILKEKLEAHQSSSSIPFDILTLSGGGSRGAFGTGFLLGWTDKGDIPNFDVVTGISTGAVMAPFIFLGGEELESVKYFYTKSTTKDVFEDSWWNFFGDGYIMNAEPLKKLFKKNFNKEFLDKIAQEHKKGRRLYIGTTNIDTAQLTVWDMGAIASSDRADKYQHFSDIIYASTALPVYLPPQYIQVDVNDTPYYQMHVDGGIYSQVFMVGLLVNWADILHIDEESKKKLDVNLYTVANRKYRLRDIYKPVEQDPFSIIEAYVLTEMDLLFDRSIYRLYKSCKKKNVHFKLVGIPDKMEDIIIVPTEFNPEKMEKLYNIGYSMGYKGVEWKEHIDMSEYDDIF